MASKRAVSLGLLVASICVAALSASAQSFRVQCPPSTITHPLTGTLTAATCNTSPLTVGCNNAEPAYNGPTVFGTVPVSGTAGGYVKPTANINGAIKCQQVSGGDGFSTMADGTQIFMFSFGPLSGLADIAAGLPGSEPPYIFNDYYKGTLLRGDPATTDGAQAGSIPWTGGPSSPFVPAFSWNGAVGLAPDVSPQLVNISDILEGSIAGTGGTAPGCTAITAHTVTAWTDEPLGIPVGGQVIITSGTAEGGISTPVGYLGTFTVTCLSTGAISPSPGLFTEFAFQYIDTNFTGLAADTGNSVAGTASSPTAEDGHVDPRPIMDVGVMNGNIPAPMIAFDEDDEFFLTLTNVGMIMRPDLFEQHTIHFHGYPNASSFYDGVPDASVAINIGGSFTYYYLAPDAGTYFWHCHITPPEHLQMGMVGQLYVRPRQDRVPAGQSLYTSLGYQNGIGVTTADLRTECKPGSDILCSATMPAVNTGATQGTNLVGLPQKYVYNDGDGSTAYDVEYPIQMHGFDPNFHFVGMTFNPEMFVDMKDKYFLLNGRSYPDTVAPGPQATVSTDGIMHYSQPLPAVINIPVGGKASLRLVNLSVAEYFTLQTLGVPMKVVGWNAKLLRDQAGMNTEYYTNSITLGGGESNDVILDASDASCGGVAGCGASLYPAGSVFYLYEPDLDRLSNDAENFGGMMTEVHICNTVTAPSGAPAAAAGTFGNVCQ